MQTTIINGYVLKNWEERKAFKIRDLERDGFEVLFVQEWDNGIPEEFITTAKFTYRKKPVSPGAPTKEK